MFSPNVWHGVVGIVAIFVGGAIVGFVVSRAPLRSVIREARARQSAAALDAAEAELEAARKIDAQIRREARWADDLRWAEAHGVLPLVRALHQAEEIAEARSEIQNGHLRARVMAAGRRYPLRVPHEIAQALGAHLDRRV